MEEPIASIFWVERRTGRKKSGTGMGRWRTWTRALSKSQPSLHQYHLLAIILYFNPEDRGSNSSKIVEKFDQTTTRPIPEVIIIVTAMRKSNLEFFNMVNV